MRGRPLVLVVLLGAGALASGCVGDPASGPASGDAAGDDPFVRAAAAHARDAPLRESLPPADPPLVKTPLAVGLEVREPWVRPRQAFEARATVPEGATLSWYVWADGGDAFVRPLNGFHYLGGAAPPEPLVDGGHRHAPAPHDPLRSGALAPGDSTPPVAFPEEGRYVIASDLAPHALVNVTVNLSARLVEVAHATLVQDDAGVRWSPSEMEIHPATRVRFWNAAEGTQTFSERRFLVAVPSDAPVLSFIAVDPGAYEVVALARQGEDAWGEAAQRVVIDFESPPARQALGPYGGRVSSLPTPDAPERRAHVLRLAHDARHLALTLRAGSDAPAPHALSWRLLHEGEEVSAAAPGATRLEAADLPRGEYVLEVVAEEGVLVGYEASGEAIHRLEPPS